jgi:polyribonucleotide nucleotidyltransferase
MDYRIFHYTDSSHRLTVTDANIVLSNQEKTVYHTDSEKFEAIRVPDEGYAEILLKNGETTETRIQHIREKEYTNEEYIVGFGYYATSAQIGFYGEVNNKLEHEWSTTRIRIGDGTVIHGTADYSNDWDWEIKKEASKVYVRIVESGGLSSVFDEKTYVIVGSEKDNLKPTDVFYRV